MDWVVTSLEPELRPFWGHSDDISIVDEVEEDSISLDAGAPAPGSGSGAAVETVPVPDDPVSTLQEATDNKKD